MHHNPRTGGGGFRGSRDIPGLWGDCGNPDRRFRRLAFLKLPF